MAFPFLTVFMIFIIILAVKLRQSYARMDQADKEFWRRERIANSTPAKDISKLHYLTIPLDKFPFGFSSDPEIIA
ncbi:MAG: hypothetical protein K5773_06135, partial [Pseudobutyrivibrio sp.]|nr:hypothetical protein [Pseudobutyrivibrio sp.]